MEAKELFISYGRDALVTKFVQKLKGDLEGVGFSVWVDMNDIPAGSDWHGAIGTGLSGCKAILPVLTNKYLNSRYCVNELYTADSDKKLIFPIMLEDVSFEASESGQGVKFVISAVNWTLCRIGIDDYEASMVKLITAMKAKGLGGGDGNTEMKKPSPQPTPSFAPLIGPRSTMPFMVIPDVENPEGITSTQGGQLVVSSMMHKVLIFNSSHEKVLQLGGEAGVVVGQFLSPSGVAVDSEDNILVASHYFVQKFTSSGRFLQQVGGMGKDGEFYIDSPRGMAVGKDDRIYISEQKKNWVTILNPDLSLYKRFTDADRMLGSGHLNMPQGIAINSEGNVYVADMMNHVVQVFDPEGSFLFRFGGMGAGPGTTPSPTGVAIDTEDYVYVASGYMISIFDPQGKFMRVFGEHGSEVGKFHNIRCIHIDRHGVLYAGEWVTNRIQMFKTQDSDGSEVVTEKTQELTLQRSTPGHQLAINTEQSGGTPGKVGVIFAKSASSPCKQAGVQRPVKILEIEKKSINSMAVGENGVIVISSDKKIILYDSDHKQLHQNEIPRLANAHVAFDRQNTTIVAISSVVCIARLDMELNVVIEVVQKESPDLKPLTTPYATAIGSQGRLYIAGRDKCHIVNADFSYHKTFAEDCQAYGIATSSTGNVYLPHENTIKVFCPEGKQLFQFGGPGRVPLPHMALLVPRSVAVDCHDNVYVGIGLKCVNKFDSEGRFLEPFLMQGTIKDEAQPLCTDPSGETLYVGIRDKKMVCIYKLTD